MKTMLITISLIYASFVYGQADSAYYGAMAKGMEQLKNCKEKADYLQTANYFQFVWQAAQGEWLPAYYSGFCYIMAAFNEEKGDQTDQYLDLAQGFIDKSIILDPNESEILALQGMLHQARIKVSPMSRGKKYSELANKSLEEAKTFNPQNPRIYYLFGQNIFNTPKMFGGGAEAAKPYFEEASAKFSAFNPKTMFYPNWGAKTNSILLEKCSK